MQPSAFGDAPRVSESGVSRTSGSSASGLFSVLAKKILSKRRLLLVGALGVFGSLLAVVGPIVHTASAQEGVLNQLVVVTVPYVEDSSGNNIFRDAAISITWTHMPGTGSNCTDTASSTARVSSSLTPSGTGADRVVSILVTGASLNPGNTGNRCVYSLTFQSRVDAPNTNLDLVLVPSAGDPPTYSADNAAVGRGTYTFTQFNPSVDVAVPALADSDGDNLFRDLSFEVTFDRVSGSDDQCTETASSSFVIADDGSVGLAPSSVLPALEGTPLGLTSSCEYDVGLPDLMDSGQLDTPNTDLDLVLLPGFTTTVGPDDTDTTGDEEAVMANYASAFESAITITVPDIDHSDGNNFYSGTEFTVTFTPVSGSDDECQSVSATVMIGNDGLSSVTSPSPSVYVIDRSPEPTASQCSYDVGWPAANTARTLGLAQMPAATSRVNSDMTDASAAYVATAITLTPSVSITVPGIDDDGNSANDFSGVEFMVGFAPVTGSDTACSAMASSTFVVGDDGSVALMSGSALPSLVDIPAGKAVRCSYDVTHESTKATSLGTLSLQTGATALIGLDITAVTAVYTLGATMFTPSVLIAVPQIDDSDGDNIFAGQEFTVRFAPVSGSDAGCTASGSSVFVVGDDGSVVLMSGSALPALVDRPPGVTARCSYDVTFPATVGTLSLQAGATATVDAVRSSATAVYLTTAATTFTPSVTITVPQLDVDTDQTANNDFSGVEFMVEFAPVPLSDAGCSAAASSTFVVGDDGSVALMAGSALPALVDVPAGAAAQCSYDITFPAARTTMLGQLALLPGATGTIDSTTAAMADYSALLLSNLNTQGPSNSFAERVRIDINPTNNCDPGTQRPARATNVLEARTSISLGLLSQDCNWEVTFRVWQNSLLALCPVSAQVKGTDDSNIGSAVSSGSQTGSLELTGAGGDGLLTYQDSAVERIEFSTACTLTFDPQVTFNFPSQDHTPADGVSDFSGETFTVDFAPVMGSDSRCTAASSSVFAIDDDGMVSLATNSSVPELRSRDVGQSTECEYSVAFMTSATELTFVSSSRTTLTPSARSVAANFSGPRVMFSPMPTILVPQPQGEGENSPYAGATFRVSFRQPILNTLCTEADSSVYIINNDGTVGLMDLAAGARLVGVPPTVSYSPCDYQVSFPARITTPAGTLVLEFPRVVPEIDINSAPVQAGYFSRFDVTVVIRVPDVDADGDNANDFSGVEFAVGLAPASGSHRNCSSSRSLNFTVGDDGSPTFGGSASSVNLVDRPLGTADRCVYDVTFPATVTATAGSLALQAGATTSVNGGAANAEARYATGFDPVVNITVPALDADSNSANDFSGVEFTVGFARASGADTGCTASGSSTFVVGDNGSVAVASDSALPALVGRVGGATADCSYDVSFPATVDHSSSAAVGLALLPGAVTTISPGAATAQANYGSIFEPAITVVVPQDDNAGGNVYRGTTFGIEIVRTAASAVGCSAASGSPVRATLTIGADGASSGTAPRLVGQLQQGHTTPQCAYTITFPAAPAGLVAPAQLTAEVSSASPAAQATYQATARSFAPAVSVSVPGYDDDSNSENDFTGATFGIEIVRTAASSAGCSAASGSPVRATLTIGADGASSGVVPMLVDRPQGDHNTPLCSYTVTFPATATTSVGTLRLQPGATTTLAAATSATAVYALDTTMFSPTVSVTVPDFEAGETDFTELTFMVGFARVSGSDAGCTASGSATFVVGASGSASLMAGSALPSLVDRPASVTARCSYDVMFPSSVGALALQSGATATVDAAMRAASASYQTSAVSTFSVTVSVMVPTDGNNDFSGEEFVVGIAPATGSGSGCSSSTSVTVTIGSSGSGSASLSTLVDRPAGATVRCRYQATFPSTRGTLELQSAQVRVVTASTGTVSASYVRRAAVAILTSSLTVENTTPPNSSDPSAAQVIIGLNTVNDCDPGNRRHPVDTLTLGAGEQTVTSILSQNCNWEITFRQAAGVCAVEATVLGAGDAVLGSEADARLVLAGDGSNGPLLYMGSAVGKIQFMVSQSTCSSTFSPAIAITIPQEDDRAGNNIYASLTASVVFAAVDNSHARCTQSAAANLVVNNDGDVVLVEPASRNRATLVDSPFDSSANCRYSVTFPARIGALGLVARSDTEAGPTAMVRASAADATAVYRPLAIEVNVVAIYPSDEVFFTSDKVEYGIFVEPPCGGFIGVIPRAFGGQGDQATAQVFPGALTIYGEPLNQISNNAKRYSVSAYADAAGTQPCSVRVTELRGPQRCLVAGGPIQTQTYSEGLASFAFTFTHTCGDFTTGQLAFPQQGWVMLPFNGETGTTPEAFARELEGAVASVWVWDDQTQSWKGWVAGVGTFGLTSLTKGDAVVAYMPVAAQVSYSPASLLEPPAATGSLVVPPMYSLQIFGGETSRSLPDLLGSAWANVIPVVFRWNNQAQEWNYFLPGRQPLPSVDIPWFDTINPGDVVFVFNATSEAVTIPWS